MPAIDTSQFLAAITDAFDLRVSNLDLSTPFRQLKEWDSMVSVSIVAAAYADHDVQISSDDLLSCKTLDDLKHLIESRLPSAL